MPIRLCRSLTFACAWILFPGVLPAATAAKEPEAGSVVLHIGRMTTNARETPLGIPADDISFAWEIRSSARDVHQMAYQVRVGSAAARDDVWNSGRTASREQIDVTLPALIGLTAATRYFWQVRVWDDQGHRSEWSPAAWFETGLLSASDWAGAVWIGHAVRSGADPRHEQPASLPRLRRSFTVDRKILQARAYVSARGLYQLSINGRKVGDDA